MPLIWYLIYLMNKCLTKKALFPSLTVLFLRNNVFCERAALKASKKARFWLAVAVKRGREIFCCCFCFLLLLGFLSCNGFKSSTAGYLEQLTYQSWFLGSPVKRFFSHHVPSTNPVGEYSYWWRWAASAWYQLGQCPKPSSRYVFHKRKSQRATTTASEYHQSAHDKCFWVSIGRGLIR